MSFITLKDVSKAYGGAPALRNANLTIEAGEIHALMGENGAGKSTLIKILAGVVAPDVARITIDDQTVTIGGPAEAHRHGFRFIHQEFNIIPALSVAENIFAGRRYPLRFGPFVDWRTLRATARDALERLGIAHIDPADTMGRLSRGDQMLVRISSAFLSESDAPARLYVMDEPTAALTRDESDRLFGVLREIRANGGSVLYVSHRLDEVMALCDRATVLRDGQTVDSGRMADITHDDLVALMIGRRVENAYPAAAREPRAEILLEVPGLSTGRLRDVSFNLRSGEILGIAGLAGAGQRELLRALFGDLRLRSGQIVLDGKSHRPASPSAAWAAKVAYVPRERRGEGLMLTRPIFENITLAHLGRQSLGGAFLTPRAERRFATKLAADVRLRAAGQKQLAGELSGGNQQKVVFARALAGEPRLLLLDEPTRGVDVGAKFDIYAIIREMTAKGMSVILVSSDLPELLGMSDRIAIMREGAISEILDARGLTEDVLLNRIYGRTGVAA